MERFTKTCRRIRCTYYLDRWDWKEVAKGRKFNHKFGYGVLDGYRIIDVAKRHQLVNKQTVYETSNLSVDIDIPENDEGVSQTVSISEEDLKKIHFYRLEHITVTVTIEHARRGDISIYLKSPHGFVSEMVASRPNDWENTGFQDWTMMTVKHW